MYEALFLLYKNEPTKCSVRLASKYCRWPLLRDWVIMKTPNLSKACIDHQFEYKFIHRIIWIFHGLTWFRTCMHEDCNNLIGFRMNKGCFVSNSSMASSSLVKAPNYYDFCCKKCAQSSEIVLHERSTTCLQKYGVSHQMKVKEIAERSLANLKAETLRKYGVEWTWQREDIKAKKVESNLRTYGFACAMQNQDVKKRREVSVERKYGVKSVASLPEVKRKRHATRLKKFGSLHPTFAYEYDGEKFDSCWELEYWIWCKDHGKQIKREPTILEFTVANKLFHVVPDFEVDGKLIEIKGDFFFENSDPTKKMIHPWKRAKIGSEKLKMLDEIAEAKHQCLIANGVVILTSKDMKPIEEYVQRKFGATTPGTNNGQKVLHQFRKSRTLNHRKNGVQES